MEYCQGCGARRDGDSRYCLQCGRQFPGEVQRKPDTGIAKYLGRVGPLALLFFFLPWVTVSCQMGGASQSCSGWDCAAC
jgi:hypothetical protein